MQWVALNQNGIVFLSGHGCNLIAHIMLKAHMIWQCLFLIAASTETAIERCFLIIRSTCTSTRRIQYRLQIHIHNIIEQNAITPAGQDFHTAI